MGWVVYASLGLMAGLLPRMVLGAGTDVGYLLGLGATGGAAGAGGGLGHELGDRMRVALFWAGLLVLVGLLEAHHQGLALLYVSRLLFPVHPPLAFITNPTDSAFRSFLTELSFRRHLRDLHRPAAPESDDVFSQTPGHLETSSGPTSPPTPGPAPSSTADPSSINQHVPPAPAPFRFTNRVSISLRTPPYAFHSFGLFSIVAVPADASSSQQSTSSSSSSTANTAGRQTNRHHWMAEPSESDALLAGVWFLGAFGRWWLMGAFRGLDEKSATTTTTVSGASKQTSGPALQLGVKDVKALDGSEEAVAAALHHHKKGLDSELPPPYSHSPPPSPRQAQARLAKARSRQPSLDHEPVLSTPDSSTPPNNNNNKNKPDVQPPLTGSADHPDQHPPPPQPPSTTTLGGEPTIDLPTLLPLPQVDPTLLSANPALNDLHHALKASHATTTDLLGQLSHTSTASAASQGQLRRTVEELRARKTLEDADRLEVKARTKSLEESKRQAEAAKREADKKLRHAESVRDAVLARIDELTRQMDDASGRMAAQRAEMAASDEHVRVREQEIKDGSALKRKKVALAEVRVGGLLNDVKELEGLVRYEEESLEHAKHEAVFQIEEARKLMASYSTYGNGQFRPRTVESDLYTAHSQPPSNIVNSNLPAPASSIFDLPIQQLPLSLLQRRRQQPHESVPPSAQTSGLSRYGPSAEHNASSSHLNDVFGFEDFGPGVPPRSLNHFSTASRENLQAAAALVPSHAQQNQHQLQPFVHTPPSHVPSSGLQSLAADDSSEDDMGSPNVMSASFTDLLPRGLFQSLSADGLLSPDPDKGSLRHAQFFHGADSDSDDAFDDDEGDHNDQQQQQHGPTGADEEPGMGETTTLPDSALPSSPRSVFSNDPRSLLLEGPEGEEGTQHLAPSSHSVFGPAAPVAASDLSPNSMPFVPTLPSAPSARNSTDSLALSTGLPNSYGASPGGGAGSRFFSSIRAFAPSAAERQALTRALKQNGSNRSLDVIGDSKHPPSPPSQSVVPFYANGRIAPGSTGGGQSRHGSNSPFSTPHGSSSDLNRDRLAAAAAWDAPARPSLEETRTRTKSFSRFFGLGSTFSRKEKDASDGASLGSPFNGPSHSLADQSGLVTSNWKGSSSGWKRSVSASAKASPHSVWDDDDDE